MTNIDRHFVATIDFEMDLPSHWLTAIFNGDQSGFTDREKEQYNAFIKDMNSQYCNWRELDCDDEVHFMKDHDATKYGVLACDVATVTFWIPEQKEKRLLRRTNLK